MANQEEMTVTRPPSTSRGKDKVGDAISTASTGAGIAAAVGGLVTLGPLGLLMGLLPKMGGVLAKRMHESELDAAAADVDLAYELNKQISDDVQRASQLPDLSPVDMEQLQAVESQRRKWSALTQHSNPAVRARATQELAQLSTAPWLEDVEGRLDTLEDATRQARAEHGKSQVTKFEKFRDKADGVLIEGNSILNMVNKLGSDNPSVQSAFQTLVGRVRKDEDLGVSFAGLGVEAGNRVASGDEIIKAVTAIMAATTDVMNKRQGAIVEDLKKRNYPINTSEDGSLTIDAEQTPVARVRPDKIKGGQESSTLDTVERFADKAWKTLEDGGFGKLTKDGASAGELLEQATATPSGPMNVIAKKRRATN